MDNSNPVLGSEQNVNIATHFLDPIRILNEIGIKEGSIISDFGSGSGHFTVLMAERVGKDGRVYGIDVQESALENLKTKIKASSLENVETIRADLEVLGGTKLLDNSQDMVLLSDTLFQSIKKADMIKEAQRILKMGAMLVVIEWKKGIGKFGPPEELKTDESTINSLVTENGFNFVRNIDTGQFHLGMIFSKK